MELSPSFLGKRTMLAMLMMWKFVTTSSVTFKQSALPMSPQEQKKTTKNPTT
jgi:hypothetical protein